MRQKFTGTFEVVLDDLDKPVNKEDLINYLQDAINYLQDAIILDTDNEGYSAPEDAVVSMLFDWETLKES